MEIINTKKGNIVIKRAVAILKKGGLVIYPTETCYGIGADATNQSAVRKLLEFKGSRGGKPIAVAVVDKIMAQRYVEINETAKNLYQKFLPGPLTVVSKSKGRVVAELEAGQKTWGIRIPDYPLAIKIVEQFSKPITATSANTSGKKTPYCLADILKYTTKKRLSLVDLFLDAGRLPFHLPSTVVDTTLNELAILRQGEIKIKSVPGKTFLSDSEEETKEIAHKVFEKYKKLLTKKALVFALQGELGSGKTQFAKGLGRALGIKENIVSPTFTIIREYPFNLKLQGSDPCKSGVFYHSDTWRLGRGEELLELGLEKMMKPGNVIAIEWLQKIKPILDKLEKQKEVKLIWVTIDGLSEMRRKISYKSQ